MLPLQGRIATVATEPQAGSTSAFLTTGCTPSQIGEICDCLRRPLRRNAARLDALSHAVRIVQKQV